MGEGSSIRIMGRQYDLIQFHFHRPSEERINGRGFDMVAHLVHKDLDGRLAVVAVLLQRGSDHPLVQTLWNNLPLEKNVGFAPEVSIDLNQLLPEDRRYFAYMGSLTTPPLPRACCGWSSSSRCRSPPSRSGSSPGSIR